MRVGGSCGARWRRSYLLLLPRCPSPKSGPVILVPDLPITLGVGRLLSVMESTRRDAGSVVRPVAGPGLLPRSSICGSVLCRCSYFG